MNNSARYLDSSAFCNLPFFVLLPCFEGDRKRLFMRRTPGKVLVFQNLRAAEGETLSNEAFLARCRVPADAVDTEEAWRARVTETTARSRKKASRFTAAFELLFSMSYDDVLSFQRMIVEWHEKLDRWMNEHCGDLPRESCAYQRKRSHDAVKAVGDFDTPYHRKYPFLADPSFAPFFAVLLPFCFLRDIRVRNEDAVKAEIRAFINEPKEGSPLTFDGAYRYRLRTFPHDRNSIRFEKRAYGPDPESTVECPELEDENISFDYIVLDDEKMVLIGILPKDR